MPSVECGGVFKTRQATFTSPKYPSNYANDLYCEWFLEVEENHRVSLSFDDFSTENSCEHDFVKVTFILLRPIITQYNHSNVFRFTTALIRQTLSLWIHFVVMKFRKPFIIQLKIKCWL